MTLSSDNQVSLLERLCCQIESFSPKELSEFITSSTILTVIFLLYEKEAVLHDLLLDFLCISVYKGWIFKDSGGRNKLYATIQNTSILQKVLESDFQSYQINPLPRLIALFVFCEKSPDISYHSVLSIFQLLCSSPADFVETLSRTHYLPQDYPYVQSFGRIVSM